MSLSLSPKTMHLKILTFPTGSCNTSETSYVERGERAAKTGHCDEQMEIGNMRKKWLMLS